MGRILGPCSSFSSRFELSWQVVEKYSSRVVGGLPNKNYGALDTILRDYIMLQIGKEKYIGFHLHKY